MEARTIDKRIAGLSYAKFEEEFGFRPEDKREQEWFAFKRRRLGPRMRFVLERMDKQREKVDA